MPDQLQQVAALRDETKRSLASLLCLVDQECYDISAPKYKREIEEAIDSLAALASAPVQGVGVDEAPKLDKLMDAFITSEMRGVDKYYALIFKYPDHQALFAAEDQLHAFAAWLRAKQEATQPALNAVAQLARHEFDLRWDAAAHRARCDDAVTDEYLAWLQEQAPREGVGGNVAWNAGVAWARATQPVQAVPPAGLLDVATGKIAHIFMGQCPDSVEGYDSRDPECPACRVLVAAAKPASECQAVQPSEFDVSLGSPYKVQGSHQTAQSVQPDGATFCAGTKPAIEYVEPGPLQWDDEESAPPAQTELSDDDLRRIARAVGMLPSHDGVTMRSVGHAGGMTAEDGFKFGRACAQAAIEAWVRHIDEDAYAPFKLAKTLMAQRDDALAALARASQGVQADAERWQPMETAPRDGTAVLAKLTDSYLPHTARFSDGRWLVAWDSYDLSGANDAPTHWIALPEPPLAARAQDEDGRDR